MQIKRALYNITVKSWAEPLGLAEPLQTKEKNLKILSFYSSQNSWTQSLNTALESHLAQYQDDAQRRQEFVLSVALSMTLVCNRENYMKDDGQNYLNDDIKKLISMAISDEDIRYSLITEFLGQSQHQERDNNSPDNKPFESFSNICNEQNKEMIFRSFRKLG